MKKILAFFHRLLVPKEDNNYRSKALHTDFLTMYLVIALVLTFVFKYTSFQNVLGYATDISVDKLYQLTNQEREQHGLQDLQYNSELANAAQAKAQDMFAKNYWSHYSPTGETPWDLILATHYQYSYAGENLAKNFMFSQGVMDAWMNSPTHRDNILRSQYTQVGFAVVNGILNGEQTTLVVQEFGAPLVGTSVAQITPQTTTVNAQEPVPTITIAPIAGLTPGAQKQQGPVTPAVLTQASQEKSFNITGLLYNSNIVFLSFLLLALLLDFYFATKLHIVRVSGKNLAHVIFIGFIIFGLVFLTKGAIL